MIREKNSYGNGRIIAAAIVFVLAVSIAAGATEPGQFVDGTATAGVTHSHTTTQTVLTFDDLLAATMDEVAIMPTINEVEATWTTGGVAAGDYDGDQFPDLFVLGGDAGSSRLFRNLGDGTFEDKTVAAGVLISGERASGAGFVDYDGDGDLDLFVGGVLGTAPRLYRNDSGSPEVETTFTEVFATTFTGFDLGHTPDTWGGTWSDYDADGDLDLFLPHTMMPFGPVVDTPIYGSTRHVWRNEGDGTFTDATMASGLGAAFAGPDVRDETMTANLTDIDSDGYPDLLFAADSNTSRVYRNNVDGTFTEITVPDQFDRVSGMGASLGDYDNDGDLDWFIANIDTPTTGHRLFRNNGDGTITDVSSTAGTLDGGHWGWGACMADLDNDRYLDIIVVNGFYWDLNNPATPDGRWTETPVAVYISNGDGSFTEKAAEIGLDDTGEGRGLSCFDYDGDGDIDVALSNHRGPFKLYTNTLTVGAASASGFLTFDLHGRQPNSEGVDALLRVTSLGVGEEGRLTRQIRAGSNFVSADPATAHFGLGDWQGPFEIEVTWLGGQSTTLAAVAPDQHLVIEQIELRLLTDDLTFAASQTVLLEASAAGPADDDRDADIRWSEGDLDNVLASGPTFDASALSTGAHEFILSVADSGGAVTRLDFLVELHTALFGDGFESGNTNAWSFTSP